MSYIQNLNRMLLTVFVLMSPSALAAHNVAMQFSPIVNNPIYHLLEKKDWYIFRTSIQDDTGKTIDGYGVYSGAFPTGQQIPYRKAFRTTFVEVMAIATQLAYNAVDYKNQGNGEVSKYIGDDVESPESLSTVRSNNYLSDFFNSIVPIDHLMQILASKDAGFFIGDRSIHSDASGKVKVHSYFGDLAQIDRNVLDNPSWNMNYESKAQVEAVEKKVYDWLIQNAETLLQSTNQLERKTEAEEIAKNTAMTFVKTNMTFPEVAAMFTNNEQDAGILLQSIEFSYEALSQKFYSEFTVNSDKLLKNSEAYYERIADLVPGEKMSELFSAIVEAEAKIRAEGNFKLNSNPLWNDLEQILEGFKLRVYEDIFKSLLRFVLSIDLVDVDDEARSFNLEEMKEWGFAKVSELDDWLIKQTVDLKQNFAEDEGVQDKFGFLTALLALVEMPAQARARKIPEGPVYDLNKFFDFHVKAFARNRKKQFESNLKETLKGLLPEKSSEELENEGLQSKENDN